MTVEIAVYVLQGFLAASFLAAGSPKLYGTRYMVRAFDKFGYPQWLRYVTGTTEILAGAGLVAGFWYPAAASAAGFALVPIMCGATWTNYHKATHNYWWVTGLLVLAVAFMGVYRFPALRAFAGF